MGGTSVGIELPHMHGMVPHMLAIEVALLT